MHEWRRFPFLVEGGVAGDCLSDAELVDLRDSFVGEHRFEVVGVPEDPVFEADAVGAAQRAALAGDGQGFADVVELPLPTCSRRSRRRGIQPIPCCSDRFLDRPQ